jgi:hypothetical protein
VEVMNLLQILDLKKNRQRPPFCGITLQTHDNIDVLIIIDVSFIIMHCHCCYCIRVQCLYSLVYHIQHNFFFPSIFCIFFLTLSLNFSFLEVKYKAFLRLLFGLTGVFCTFSIMIGIYDMLFILPMYLSDIKPTYITIIHVKIGVL